MRPFDDALIPGAIFVFGSNLAGRHGAGAALYARQNFGAVYGQGEGLQGRSYALPTKSPSMVPLPLMDIKMSVIRLFDFARTRTDLVFQVTRVGCGLAGYKDQDIAPLFRRPPGNVRLPRYWTDVLRLVQ